MKQMAVLQRDHNYQKFKIGCAEIYCILKVGENEKNGGSGRSQMLDNGLGPWRSRFIFHLNMQFLR